MITIFYSTFIFLFVLYISETFSQVCQYEQKADSLLKCGQYHEAFILYERCLYEAKENSRNNEFILKQSQALKLNQNFQAAYQRIELADYSVMSDSQQYIFRQQASLLAYLSGNFQEAISHVLQCKFFLNDSSRYKSLLPIVVLSQNELYQYAKAKETAFEYVAWLENTGQDSGIFRKSINEIYRKNHIPKVKISEKASTMSAILPGLGQIYAGYPEEGLLSFVLITSSLCTGIYGFYKKYYFSGYFVGLSLFQKFYFGGIRRAEQLTEKHNALKTAEFNQKVRQLFFR